MLVRKHAFNVRQLRSEDTLDSLQQEAVCDFLELVSTCLKKAQCAPVEFAPADFNEFCTLINVNFDNIVIELTAPEELLNQKYIERYESRMLPGTNREEDDVILDSFYKHFSIPKKGFWKPQIALRLINIDGKTYSFYTIEPVLLGS